MPGDAIVVPTQLDFETWGRALVRNLKDFGQIFYQFGLGAAALGGGLVLRPDEVENR